MSPKKKRQMLLDVLKVTSLQTASFERSETYKDEYPTNEKEADAFIKQRTRLWLSSRIETPLSVVVFMD